MDRILLRRRWVPCHLRLFPDIPQRKQSGTKDIVSRHIFTTGFDVEPNAMLCSLYPAVSVGQLNMLGPIS